MEASTRDPQRLLPILCCPLTRQPLALKADPARLETANGEHTYPIIDGIPVLLPPTLIEAWLDHRNREAKQRYDWYASKLARFGPSLSLNVGTAENYRRLCDELQASVGPDDRANVLVIGGATEGLGISALRSAAEIELLGVDLAIGPSTQVVSDAHVLPFRDGTFDAVVCQAVLEHVADPPVAVAEIHRVLKPLGWVYSEIPFMQQVHEGAHDVTRYTLVGHRRLFRAFTEVSSGVQNGPGMALAWSVRYFILAFPRSALVRAALSRAVTWSCFWLKYFDYYLAKRPGGVDAASGTFFLGRRSDRVVSDEEVFDGYQGAVNYANLASRS